MNLEDFDIYDWMEGLCRIPGFPKLINNWRPPHVKWGSCPDRALRRNAPKHRKRADENSRHFNDNILPGLVGKLSADQMWDIARCTDSPVALAESKRRLWVKGNATSWLEVGHPREREAMEMGATVVPCEKYSDGLKPREEEVVA